MHVLARSGFVPGGGSYIPPIGSPPSASGAFGSAPGDGGMLTHQGHGVLLPAPPCTIVCAKQLDADISALSLLFMEGRLHESGFTSTSTQCSRAGSTSPARKAGRMWQACTLFRPITNVLPRPTFHDDNLLRLQILNQEPLGLEL